MKVKMLNTVKRLPDYLTFHKGRTYQAQHATNLPEWKEKGKVFVQKSDGDSMVIDPLGRVIYRASSSKPEIWVGDLDLGRLKAQRRRFPVLRHRKIY